jgi:hypothetical protein
MPVQGRTVAAESCEIVFVWLGALIDDLHDLVSDLRDVPDDPKTDDWALRAMMLEAIVRIKPGNRRTRHVPDNRRRRRHPPPSTEGDAHRLAITLFWRLRGWLCP